MTIYGEPFSSVEQLIDDMGTFEDERPPRPTEDDEPAIPPTMPDLHSWEIVI